MIINGWIEKELGDVLKLNYGWSLSAKKRIAGSFSVYGSNGVVGSHNEALVSSAGLVVGRKGSAGNVHFARKPFCPIDTTFYIAPSDTSLDLEFLYFLLLHVDLTRILGDVGVPGLSREMAYKERAKFPSDRGEQRKIAAVLGVVQRAIEQQERLLALTAELKKTLLHQLFTQGLRGEPQKQTEIGLLPESWEVAKLGDIATSKSGGTPSRTKPEYWEGGSIPWVKTGEVDYCVINDAEEKITAAGLANSSAKIFPAGTLLMAMYGQGITRGKVAILGVEAATNQACVAIFPCDEVNTKFLYYFFEGKYEYIRNLGHGANQKNLSAEILKGVTVAYPKDAEEQASIVSSLEALDKKLSLHERKRASLADLFRTLLHQLMTAQIRVHDLDLPELEHAQNG